MLPPICLEGSEIWRARVPLISFVRVEWHLPERVMGQFGFQQDTNLELMEENKRVSARGKTEKYWDLEHARLTALWERRRQYIMLPVHVSDDAEHALAIYMTWYRQTSLLYLVKAPSEPPQSYYPRGQIERNLMEYWERSSVLAHRAASIQAQWTAHQRLEEVNEICQLADGMRNMLQLSGYKFSPHVEEVQHPYVPFGSSAGGVEASGSGGDWIDPSDDPEEPPRRSVREHHEPSRYTPGTGALPPRRRRRRH